MNILSLGGVPLQGNKVVRLIYMDEAGMSNPAQEPYLVVAGVIVHGDSQLINVKKRLGEIRDKYIPEDQREGFVFHATEIFNGGGKVFNRDIWPLDKRLEIAYELADIPKELGLYLTFGWMERSTFPETFNLPEDMSKKHKLAATHAMAYLTCAAMANNWMREHTPDENCLLIVEDNQTSKSMIKVIHNDFQDLRNKINSDKFNKLLHLEHVQEDPLFQEKKATNPLELADFFAYIFKRYLMNNDDKLYAPFISRFSDQFAAYG